MKVSMEKTKESGQVLLITIMLLAVALTVVLTTSFTAKTDTQIAKLEEESQRALAAAEAGIEATLKSGNPVNINELSGLESFIGTAKVLTASESTDYSTPIKKDQAYTFYLGTYSGGTISSPTINSISMYFGPDATTLEDCGNFAFEISIISGACGNSSNCSIHRYLIDKGGNFTATAGGDPDTTDERTVTFGTYPVDGKTYKCQSDPISISQAAPDKIMMVKFLSPTGISQTEIAFRGSGGNLPPQATTVTSNAKSPGGARKEVELIQYYPQIPAEIFDTIF